MVKKDDFHLMGRRRFMKALSSIGVSTGAIATLSQEGLAELTDDPTSEVPILVGHEHNYPDGYDSPPEINPVHETVAYDRWAKIEAAYNAAAELETELTKSIKSNSKNKSEIKYVSDGQNDLPLGSQNPINVGVRHESTSKNRTDISLVVNYKKRVHSNGQKERVWEPNIPFEKVEKMAPSKSEGTFADDEFEQTFSDIPVSVEEKIEKEESDFKWEKYRPIVGGCHIGEASGTGSGSTCFSMYHLSQGERVMTTSGHVLDGWYDVEQPNHDEVVSGNTQSYYHLDDFDAGWFTVCVDQYPSIAEPNGGYINEALQGTRGIDWLKCQGTVTEFIKQGKETGRTTGTVYEIENETEHKFDSTCYSDGGDSGGVYYQDVDDGYWLIGLHNWATGKGNGIERVEERLNVVA